LDSIQIVTDRVVEIGRRYPREKQKNSP